MEEYSAQEFIDAEESKKNIELRPKQKEAIRLIGMGKSVVIIVPTGYGKTIPAIYAVLYMRSKGLVTIWLAPLKSLTNEQLETLKKYVGERILIVTGDYRENKKKILSHEYDVVIMTYEMLNVMMANESKRGELMENVGCIVTDEAHNVVDGERGAKLESTFHISETFYPNLQRVSLSATVGNHEKFARWLKSEIVFAPPEDRPVPLEKRIITFQKEKSAPINFDTKMGKLREFITSVAKRNPKIIIFCSSRDRCSKIAEALNGYCGLRFAFHHAGLKAEKRREVEEGFRNKEIDVVCATPTLAAGVNTPADITILFDVTRWNWRTSTEEFITRNEMIQMIGRAGRFGISQFGLAIAICGTEERDIIDDMWNNPLVVDSQIPKQCDLVSLQWVVSGIHSEDDLLFCYSGIFTEPENLDSDQFLDTIRWLCEKRFIEQREDGDYYALTLGKLTVAMAVRPKTSLHFLSVISEIDNPNATLFDLFKIVLNTEEFTDNIVVRNTRADGDCIMVGQRFLGRGTDDRLSKAFAMTFNEYLATTFNTPRVPVGSADEYVLRDASSRIFNACNVILGSRIKNNKNKFDFMNMGIKQGILDEDILVLTQMEKIGTTRAILLKKAGIKTLKQFIDTANARLKQILGRISFQQIDQAKDSARQLIKEQQGKSTSDEDDNLYFDFSPPPAE